MAVSDWEAIKGTNIADIELVSDPQFEGARCAKAKAGAFVSVLRKETKTDNPVNPKIGTYVKNVSGFTEINIEFYLRFTYDSEAEDYYGYEVKINLGFDDAGNLMTAYAEYYYYDRGIENSIDSKDFSAILQQKGWDKDLKDKWHWFSVEIFDNEQGYPTVRGRFAHNNAFGTEDKGEDNAVIIFEMSDDYFKKTTGGAVGLSLGEAYYIDLTKIWY